MTTPSANRYDSDWAAIEAAKDFPEAWVFEDLDAYNRAYVIVTDPADADRLSNMDPEQGDWYLVWSSIGGLADA